MTRSVSPSSAYDGDFFTWTREQASALRRARNGALLGVDIEHCAGEIEDLGKRDLREVDSFLRLLFLNLMKITAAPNSPDVRHWRSEAREFRRAASRAFSPGMRQLIDMAVLWREAAERLDDDRRDAGLPPAPIARCPFELCDLLAADFDLDRALATLTAPSAHLR